MTDSVLSDVYAIAGVPLQMGVMGVVPGQRAVVPTIDGMPLGLVDPSAAAAAAAAAATAGPVFGGAPQSAAPAAVPQVPQVSPQVPQVSPQAPPPQAPPVMQEPRAEDVISEMNAVDQFSLLQLEEDSLIKQRRQLQELLYKLTIEEITLRQPK